MSKWQALFGSSWSVSNRRENGVVPIIGSVIARAVNIFHVRYRVPPSSLGKKAGTEEKVDFLKTIPVLQQLLHA